MFSTQIGPGDEGEVYLGEALSLRSTSAIPSNFAEAQATQSKSPLLRALQEHLSTYRGIVEPRSGPQKDDL